MCAASNEQFWYALIVKRVLSEGWGVAGLQPPNRNKKKMCIRWYQTLCAIYASANISHWNRLIPSTLAFEKHNNRKSQMKLKNKKIIPCDLNWVMDQVVICIKMQLKTVLCKHKWYTASVKSSGCMPGLNWNLKQQI